MQACTRARARIFVRHKRNAMRRRWSSWKIFEEGGVREEGFVPFSVQGFLATREEGRGRSSAGRNPSSLFCANSSRLRRGSPPEGPAFFRAPRPGIFSFRLLIISQKTSNVSSSPPRSFVRLFPIGRGEGGRGDENCGILDEGERKNRLRDENNGRLECVIVV